MNKYQEALDIVDMGSDYEEVQKARKLLKELIDLSHVKECKCGGISETRFEPGESWCECPNCGEEIGFMVEYVDDSFYCPYCGQSVTIPRGVECE